MKSFDNIRYMLESDTISTEEVVEQLLHMSGHSKRTFTKDNLTHSSMLFDDDVGVAIKELDRIDKKKSRLKVGVNSHAY